MVWGITENDTKRHGVAPQSQGNRVRHWAPAHVRNVAEASCRGRTLREESIPWVALPRLAQSTALRLRACLALRLRQRTHDTLQDERLRRLCLDGNSARRTIVLRVLDGVADDFYFPLYHLALVGGYAGVPEKVAVVIGDRRVGAVVGMRRHMLGEDRGEPVLQAILAEAMSATETALGKLGQQGAESLENVRVWCPHLQCANFATEVLLQCTD